jgi:hypothetical protein
LYIPEFALKNGLGHINIPFPLLLLFPFFSAFLPVFAVKVQEIDLNFLEKRNGIRATIVV